MRPLNPCASQHGTKEGRHGTRRAGTEQEGQARNKKGRHGDLPLRVLIRLPHYWGLEGQACILWRLVLHCLRTSCSLGAVAGWRVLERFRVRSMSRFSHLVSLLLLAVTAPALAQTGAGQTATSPLAQQPSVAAVNPVSPSPTSPIPTKPLPQVVPTPPTQSLPEEETEEAISLPTDPAAWARQTITVASCAQPPTIDGKLNDACWKTATKASGFFRYGGGRPAPAAEQTQAWICADKTHLYFAFRCLDDHPELIKAGETVRNGNIGQDDFVGLDIDSQNNRRGFSTFIVTPRGTQFEQIEGGTADNITWAGDWTTAVQRTKHGWTCEMAIPFALMRYPRGANAFGIVLYRKLGRETSLQGWPYMPPAGVDNSTEPQYLAEFTGFAPPFYTPRPTFLPYTLLTGGTGNSARAGVDIKYPLSTTLTGVGTLFPDFQTIEQDVTNINFSYTEKLLTDRRPFFAEGAGFLPPTDLFYSRRIGAVDEGVKVAGKQGDTTIGFLGSNTNGTSAQDSLALNVAKDIGLYSQAGVALTDDHMPGQPGSNDERVYGSYGLRRGPTRYTLTGFHTQSSQQGSPGGGDDQIELYTSVPFGKPSIDAAYSDISSNFTSALGFVPETDLRGSYISLNQYNQFDKGVLEKYDVSLNASAYQHHTGGFFHNSLNASVYGANRSGYSLTAAVTQSQRDQFHDHTGDLSLGWNGKTLYQRGSVEDVFGRQAGQPYNFLTLGQGVYVSRPFSVQLNYSRLKLGTTSSTQSILTGTYRLNPYQTIGGRVVSQGGADQGTGLGTDIYFSFSQQVRRGTDVFLLFGDPNSPQTRGKFTLKLVHPF